MQITSSQILFIPLRLVVPEVESVASCLVGRMLFIILQVRSEQTAACISFLMVIPKIEHMTILNTLMSRLRLKFLWILSYPPKLRKDGMLIFFAGIEM
jgi:hypothetical protein